MSDDITDRLAQIENRNKRVETDKAWESSWTRKLAIAFLTYIVVCIYLKFVVGVDPWINAIVPTIGFLLSTLTLGWIKSYWLQKYDK
jgi:hypothetical protein